MPKGYNANSEVARLLLLTLLLQDITFPGWCVWLWLWSKRPAVRGGTKVRAKVVVKYTLSIQSKIYYEFQR